MDTSGDQILIKQLDLANAKAVTTPGVKGALIPEEEDSHLDPSSAAQFRQFIARCGSEFEDNLRHIYTPKRMLLI